MGQGETYSDDFSTKKQNGKPSKYNQEEPYPILVVGVDGEGEPKETYTFDEEIDLANLINAGSDFVDFAEAYSFCVYVEHPEHLTFLEVGYKRCYEEIEPNTIYNFIDFRENETEEELRIDIAGEAGKLGKVSLQLNPATIEIPGNEGTPKLLKSSHQKQPNHQPFQSGRPRH